MNRFALPLGLLLAVVGHPDAHALNLSLSRADIARAVALARWPSTDSERTRFHNPYVIQVDGRKLDYIAVERIEVVTEFRRLELMTEAHAGLNDSFGRAGLQDVEEAIRPWHRRLSIIGHLRFDGANLVIPVLPAVAIVLDGDREILPTEMRPTTLGGRGAPPGEILEAIFDATSVGQASHLVVVRYKGQDLARVPVDFARLE